MGGKGGGSSGGSNLSTGTQQQSDQTHTDQTSVYQPAAFGTFQSLVNAADALTSQPFSPYGPDQFAQNWDAWPYLVAPRNTYEQQVLANAGNLYQYAAPYINAAGSMTNDAYNQAGNFGWGMLGNASNVMEGALPYVGAGGQMVQAGQPLVNQGSQLTQLGTREVPRLSGQDIEPYLSPYQQWVINATMDNIAENQSRQQEDVLGNAATRGALGGDRLAVAQAELSRQQGLSANQTLSGLWNQNYQQALQTAQGQQGVQQSNLQRQLQGGQGMGQLGGTMGQLGGTMGQLGGVQGQIGQGMGNLAGIGNQVASTQGNLASQMGNLGLANQQAFSQQLNALGAAGSQERAFEQQRLNAIYEQYLREQGFPFQALQYRAGIQMPAAGGMGGQQLGIGDQLSNMYGLTQSMQQSGQGGGGGFNPMQMIGSIAGKGLHSGGRVYADGGAINPFARGGYTDRELKAHKPPDDDLPKQIRDYYERLMMFHPEVIQDDEGWMSDIDNPTVDNSNPFADPHRASGGLVIPGQGMTKAQSIFPNIPIADPKIHWPEAVKFMPKPNKMSGSGGKGGGKGGGGSKSQMPKMPKMPTGKSEQQAGKELAQAAVQKEAQEPGTTDPNATANGQPEITPSMKPMPGAAGILPSDKFTPDVKAGEGADQVQGNAGDDNLGNNPFDTYAMGSEDYFGGAEGGLDGGLDGDLGDLGDMGGGGFDEAGFADLGGGDIGGFGGDDLMGGGGDFGGGGKGFSGGGKGFGGRVGYDEGGDVDFADFDDDDFSVDDTTAEDDPGEEDVDEVSGAERNVQLPEIVVKPEQTAPTAAPQGISPQDRDIMARTMWGEARGEPLVGQQAVANVILNRARMAGTSPAFESQKKGQFEPWMHPNIANRMRGLTPEQLAPYQKVIDQALQDDITKGATHFYSPGAQRGLGRPPPRWDDGSGRMFGTQRFFNHPYGGQRPTAFAANSAPSAPSAPSFPRETNTPTGAMQRAVATSRDLFDPTMGENNRSMMAQVSAFAPEQESRGVEGSRLPNEMHQMSQMNFPGAPGPSDQPFSAFTPERGRSASGRLSLPGGQSLAGLSEGRPPRSSASRLTLPSGLSDADMEPLQPGPAQEPAAPAPFAPPQGRPSTPSGGRANMLPGRPPPSMGSPMGMMRMHGPEGGEMAPVFPGNNMGPSPFAPQNRQMPQIAQQRQMPQMPSGPPLQSLAPMFRGMANSRSPYPGISLMEGLGAQFRGMSPQMAGQRLAQQALPPADPKTGKRVFELDDGNTATTGGSNPTHRLTGKSDENGRPVLAPIEKSKKSTGMAPEEWDRRQKATAAEWDRRRKATRDEKGAESKRDEAAFKIMADNPGMKYAEAYKRAQEQGFAEGGEIEELPEQIATEPTYPAFAPEEQPAPEGQPLPEQMAPEEVPENVTQRGRFYIEPEGFMDEISAASKVKEMEEVAKNIARTENLSMDEAREKARKIGAPAPKVDPKESVEQLRGLGGMMNELINDPLFATAAGPNAAHFSQIDPSDLRRQAYEKMQGPDNAAFLDRVRGVQEGINGIMQRAMLTGQGQVTEWERKSVNKILGEIVAARRPEDAKALMQQYDRMIGIIFDPKIKPEERRSSITQMGRAPDPPPPMPKNLSEGSKYNFERKLWRDPSGKIYDLNGKPVQ